MHISVYAHLSVVALLLGYAETPAICRTIFTFLPHGISITQNQTLISLLRVEVLDASKWLLALSNQNKNLIFQYHI